MRLAKLRPVGDAIRWPRASDAPAGWGPDYVPVILQSGTEALALSLSLLREDAKREDPSVVIPAYACPSLVSAARFAGLRVVLADLAANSPFVGASTLIDLIDEHTVAVVAPHFLGIEDSILRKQGVCKRLGVALVEDSAQLYPRAFSAARNAQHVILSFGRGKPASALGGGLLLIRKDSPSGAVGNFVDEAVGEGLWQRSKSGLRRCAYNLAINEIPYGLVSRIPGISLGDTIYKPCRSIRAAGPYQCRQIVAAATRRRRRATAAQAMLRAVVHDLDRIIDLSDNGSTAPLLRYPVLLPDAESRDTLYRRLDELGLGPSLMYGLPLTGISGVVDDRDEDKMQHFPNADSFAARLLTLPVHDGVRPAHVRRIGDLLRQFAA